MGKNRKLYKNIDYNQNICSKIMNVSWKEYEREIKCLYYKINSSNRKYSKIYGVERGGLIGGIMLSNLLNLPFSTIRKDFELVDIKNEPMLIIDDLIDSGSTLKKILRKARSKVDLTLLDICTVYVKYHSIIKPTYFNKNIKNNIWIIFPWEFKV